LFKTPALKGLAEFLCVLCVFAVKSFCCAVR